MDEKPTDKPRRQQSPARHLATLRRRMEHLNQRLAGQPPNSLSYDRAERAALRWAVEALDKRAPEVNR